MSFTTHREQLEAAEQRCAQARDMADKWRDKAEELAACALRIIEERDAARALCGDAAAMLREVFYFIDQSNELDIRAEALVARLEAVSK